MRGVILTIGLSVVMFLLVLLGALGLKAVQPSDEETEATPPVVDTYVPLPTDAEPTPEPVPEPVPLPEPEPEPEPEPAPDPEEPTETVEVQVHAPARGCWSATIEGRAWQRGCGPAELPLEAQGLVVIHFERQPGPTDWHFSTAIEVDGRIVQTVGPTTEQYPSLDIAYRVPESR